MPFSDDTLSFLFENRVNDSKAWFLEHRADYERLVLEPMRRLVVDLTPVMLAIDPLFVCEPKVGRCISRIYRDTRFSSDKSIFRDVMWCSFTRPKSEQRGRPGYYFELSPAGANFGCGWYHTPPETMDVIRDMVRNGDRLFLRAERSLKKAGIYELEDTRYKRTRNPGEPEEKRLWLDQRSICISAHSEDFDMLFSDGLYEKLAADFMAVRPFYEFLLEADLRARPPVI